MHAKLTDQGNIVSEWNGRNSVVAQLMVFYINELLLYIAIIIINS